MRRYLVVANRTVAGRHLVDLVRDCREHGPCWFFILVPATGAGRGGTASAEAQALARRRLAGAIARFEAEGASVHGEVGSCDPLSAVCAVTARYSFDEVILSTLAPGASEWLLARLPARIELATGLPVTHVIGDGVPDARRPTAPV